MLLSDDQLTDASWTPEVKARFWEAATRKRGKRNEYIGKKAAALAHTAQPNLVAEAVGLLHQTIAGFMHDPRAALAQERYPGIFAAELSRFFVDAGRYCEQMDALAAALQWYAQGEAFHVQHVAPINPRAPYEGYPHWVRLLVRTHEPAQALAVLERHRKATQPKPSDLLPFAHLYNTVARANGQFSKADAAYEAWVRDSYAHHLKFQPETAHRLECPTPWPVLEQVPYHLLDGAECNYPAAAAGAIEVYHLKACPSILKMNLVSLHELDAVLRPQNPATSPDPDLQLAHYRFDFLNSRLIPELGAYLGCVYVRQLKGHWLGGSPLMAQRVRIRDIEVNPFEQAYRVVYYHHRLVEECWGRVAGK
jgi:hypothetical protein